MDIDGLRMQFGKVTERTDRLERAFVMAKTNADTVSDRRAVDVMELEEVCAWHYDYVYKNVSVLEHRHRRDMEELDREKEGEMEKETANHKIVVDTIREELMRVQNELKSAREELSDGRDCVDFKSQHM